MNDTTLDDTELVIIAYMVASREAIMEGEALLRRVREKVRPVSSAQMLFEALRPEIARCRTLAGAREYAGCRESLEQLAGDMEALREEARRLL